MQGVPQQLQNEENYGNFEANSNKPFEDKSKMFDTAESKNIGVNCEELLNNGTLDATWLNRPVSVEAWLDRRRTTTKNPNF